MKKILLALALVSATTFGAQKSTTVRTVNESSSGSGSFWLGVTTDNFATGTATPGISSYLGFNDKLGLQMYAAIENTTPKFLFGVGANLKATVVGNLNKGFHVGGGFGLGQSATTTGNFFANIYGLLGLHWEVVNGVLLLADAGVGITITSGATTFRIGTPGTLGASLLFRL